MTIPLEYFFDVMRYKDCDSRAIYTERVLNDLCERYLKANVRFLIDCTDYERWNRIVLLAENRKNMRLREIKVNN